MYLLLSAAKEYQVLYVHDWFSLPQASHCQEENTPALATHCADSAFFYRLGCCSRSRRGSSPWPGKGGPGGSHMTIMWSYHPRKKKLTFSAFVSFFATSEWIHSCSLEPMMATLGLPRNMTDPQIWNQNHSGENGWPVLCVLEFVYDLGELRVCPGGVDNPRATINLCCTFNGEKNEHMRERIG